MEIMLNHHLLGELLLLVALVIFLPNDTEAGDFKLTSTTTATTQNLTISSQEISPILTTAIPSKLGEPEPSTLRLTMDADDSAILCNNAATILANPQEYDIIIVGAGVAGLAGAKRLLERGIGNFKVLEARDRLGGRIYTMPSKGSGYVELGAEVTFSSRIDSLLHFAASQNILVDSSGQSNVSDSLLFSEDGQKLPTQPFQDIEELFRNIRLHPGPTVMPNISCKTWLEDFVKKTVKTSASRSLTASVLDFFLRSEAIAFGDDLTKCNLQSLFRNITSNRNPLLRNPKNEVNIRGGFSRLVQALGGKVMTQSLSRDVRVSFNAEVRKIYWQVKCPTSPKMSDFVFLRLRTGALVRGRYVLLTIPIGVLTSPKSAPTFLPPLPAPKLQAMQNIGVGCSLTIYLTFESQFWPETANGVWVVWRDDVKIPERQKNEQSLLALNADWFKYIVGFRQADFLPATLQTWISGDWGNVVESMSDVAVGDVLIELLNMTLSGSGEKPNFTLPIPNLLTLTKSRWCSDPYSMGANAYLGRQTSAQDFVTMAQPLPSAEDPRLTFAGDATHEVLYGTVEGAWRSALREAERLADLLGVGSKNDDALTTISEKPEKSKEGNHRKTTSFESASESSGAMPSQSWPSHYLLPIMMITLGCYYASGFVCFHLLT